LTKILVGVKFYNICYVSVHNIFNFLLLSTDTELDSFCGLRNWPT